MSISSNAAISEKNSEFYEANRVFCEKFEKFILNKDGKVLGSFNSWSYEIHGKISKPKQWLLKYKKSTLSSGNIFFPSKYQNLHVSLEWSTLFKSEQNLDFLIRKKKFINLRQFRLKKTSILSGISKKYVVFSEFGNTDLISGMIEILSEPIRKNEIYKIQLNQNKLTIEMRTDQHYFDIFDKLNTYF